MSVAQRAMMLGASTLFEASKLDCALDCRIRAVWAGATIAAPAYPLVCSPGDNLSIHIALERAPRGSVLVVATGGYCAGYWGEVLTVAAQVAGIAGLVTDGGVRDVAAMTRRRFPVFAAGVSVRGTIKASAPSVGEPLRISGVPVVAGDLVVADDDGVVVIPADAVERVLAAGEERHAREAAMMAELEQGATTLELMGLTQWRSPS